MNLNFDFLSSIEEESVLRPMKKTLIFKIKSYIYYTMKIKERLIVDSTIEIIYTLRKASYEAYDRLPSEDKEKFLRNWEFIINNTTKLKIPEVSKVEAYVSRGKLDSVKSTYDSVATRSAYKSLKEGSFKVVIHLNMDTEPTRLHRICVLFEESINEKINNLVKHNTA